MASEEFHVRAADRVARSRVIIAAAFGPLFEWYDFFLYVALMPVLARALFGSDEPTLVVPLTLLGLCLGFAVRPLGAVLVGRLADRAGRRPALMLTTALMGVATVGAGLLPGYTSIGVLAPVLLGLLRITQGLALGGEYGIAAAFVAEHGEAHERGRRTAWLHITAPLGLLLALATSSLARHLCGDDGFGAWGWRLPFLVALPLAGVALWLRVTAAESPAFRDAPHVVVASRRTRWQMRTATGPRLVVALIGVVTCQAVVAYMGQLYPLFFMQQTLKVQTHTAIALLGIAMLLATPFFVLFGALSDRIGRKRLILTGTLLAAFAYFPVLELLAKYANPAYAEAERRHPVAVIAAPTTCSPMVERLRYDRVATSCDVVRDALDHAGIRYARVDGVAGAVAYLRIGGKQVVAAYEPGTDDRVREAARFREEFNEVVFRDAKYPTASDLPNVYAPMVVLLLTALMLFVTMVNGPIAAALVDLVPVRARCMSTSLVYQIANSWFCGVVLTAGFLFPAEEGGFYPGLGYPVLLSAAGFLIALLLAPNTPRAGAEVP